jgi:hypothetical protein
MKTGLLSVESTALLPAGWAAGGYLVLPLAGAGFERAALADTGAGDRWTAVRARLAVQAGEALGAYESRPDEAHQPAPLSRRRPRWRRESAGRYTSR